MVNFGLIPSDDVKGKGGVLASFQKNDNGTLTLLDQPNQLKYDDFYSPITQEYEVITTFMEINNISATWENLWGPKLNELKVGSFWCEEAELAV